MPKSPTKPQGSEPPTGGEKPTGQAPDAVIRDGVIRSLGRPAGLFRVVVLPLWKDHYRVNVLTGADAASVRIVNSYFVETDDGGNILRSTPKITREYE